jgi:hypothetical protein
MRHQDQADRRWEPNPVIADGIFGPYAVGSANALVDALGAVCDVRANVLDRPYNDKLAQQPRFPPVVRDHEAQASRTKPLSRAQAWRAHVAIRPLHEIVPEGWSGKQRISVRVQSIDPPKLQVFVQAEFDSCALWVRTSDPARLTAALIREWESRRAVMVRVMEQAGKTGLASLPKMRLPRGSIIRLFNQYRHAS